MTVSKNLDLTHTKPALQAYDAVHAELDAVETNEEFDAWKVRHDKALDDLRMAFYEDTKSRNNIDHCRAAGPDFFRRLVMLHG
jgi:hypothetical protein